MRLLPLALILSAAATPALAQQAAPSAQALHLRMLTWPGKVAAPGQRQAAPAPPSFAPPPAPMPAAPPPAMPARVSAAEIAPAQARPDLAWSPAYRPVAHGATHLLGDVTPA